MLDRVLARPPVAAWSLHRTCAGISASVGSTVGQEEFEGEFGIDSIDSVIWIRQVRWFPWAFTYWLLLSCLGKTTGPAGSRTSYSFSRPQLACPRQSMVAPDACGSAETEGQGLPEHEVRARR